MDRETYFQWIRGESRGLSAQLGRLGLEMATIPVHAGVQLRRIAFDRGWKTIHQASVPVVSVGNLTLGGTGKTPMVEAVCRWFRDRDVRVAILSRGYGGTEGLNDEGRVLDANLPDVPHLQDRDRVTLARIAVEELDAQVLVLDDGFQHRRLGRDLDIVLLDALEPFGLDRLFPRGLLREPVGVLRRADLVAISRADLVSRKTVDWIRERVQQAAPKVGCIECRQAPLDLLDGHGRSEPLDTLQDASVMAFCGIGNPDGFRRTLESMGVRLVDFRIYPDHHPYSRSDVYELVRWAESHDVGLALTTQKDSVKLGLDALGRVPLRTLRIGLEVLQGAETLDAALHRVLSRVRPD